MFELAERCRPGLCVLAHPAVVDEPDGDGIQKMQLLPPSLFRDDEPRLLEHAQVLHKAESRHGQPVLELAQRLAILLEEPVEELATRRVGERSEDVIHGTKYR